jgi:hypothetical protein
MRARTGRSIVAGLAGAVAYLIAQEVDRRIVNPRSNDLVLLAGPFASRPWSRLSLGLVLHLLGGASMGVFFERYAAPHLHGPYWLRGIALLQIENATLFPLVWGINRVHPAVKTGELAPLWSTTYFAQEIWRHLALGAVMGAVLGPPVDDTASTLSIDRSLPSDGA